MEISNLYMINFVTIRKITNVIYISNDNFLQIYNASFYSIDNTEIRHRDREIIWRVKIRFEEIFRNRERRYRKPFQARDFIVAQLKIPLQRRHISFSCYPLPPYEYFLSAGCNMLQTLQGWKSRPLDAYWT